MQPSRRPTEETYSMISVSTIAKLGHSEVEEAQQWTGDPSFPEPIAELHSGNLYDRLEVERWLMEHGHRGLEVPAAP